MGNAISRTDAGFGPLLEGKVYFTQLFEESVFTTVPAIVAILAALIQVYCVVGEPMLVRSGHLFVSKLVAGSTLVGCHIATLVLWAVLSTVRTEMTLPAAALAAIGSLFIVLFLHVEHFYSYRPSTFLSLFMSVTLLLDIAKTYSCFYRVGLGALFAMYTLSCITRFWLLISQEVSKRQLIRLESLRLSVGQEAASGFWTRSLFLWLNSTLLLGFRQALKVEDLPPLAPEFRANTLYAAFKLQWNRVNKRSRYALVKACILTQAVQFITITIPRLCLIGFTFAQPFLLLRTTTAVGEEDLPESTIDGLLGATALVYFGIAITKGYYTHLAYQVTVCIRGMLTVAIYDKMLRLSHEVLLESAAVTLMSTDLSGLERLVPLFHDMWAAVIELGLGLAILGKIAGPSCVLFLVPGIITTGGSSIVTKKMISARTAWNEKIQDRVAKTSNIIAQLKIIKMAGLSEPMLAFIEKLRATELKTSMRERNLRVIVGALNAFNRALAPVIVLAAAMFWTQAGDRLTSSEIYTILAVVAIISQPLATILLAIPALSGALASFPRIQNFLTQEEQVDSRSVNDDYTSVRAAGVSVNSDYSRPILQEINLQFTQGTVAMLTGPVGCGKTTLLKTLIGEVQLQAGSIEIRSCPIGYSDQVAWLENVSIRDNVCHDDYNATWYRKVLTACCLDPDLAALPLGDQTIVGTNGSNISGGQRQRVALARAVYCQAPLLVLDDPLSAVDATTASAIVERLLGNSGLLRNRNVTVLMTTSSRDLCSVADTVFSMNAEGKVQRLPGLARDAKRSHGPRQLVSAQQDGQEDLGEKANLPNDDIGDTVGDTVPNSALYSCAPIEEDRDEIRKGDRTLYAYYMGSVKLPLLILSLCLIALSSIADRLPAIFLRVWLDVDPENDEYFIGYAGLAVFKIVIASLSLYLFFRNIFVGTSTVLHRRLLTATMGTTLSFLAETDPGTMLSRFSQDMSLIAQVLPINFLNSVYMIVTVTMEVAIICAGARYTASIIPALLIIVYLVQFFYLRTSRQLRVRELEAKEPLFTKFAETASGIQHIRAFRWQEAFMLQTQELLDRSQIPYYNLFCVQRWLTLVLDLTVCAIATTLVGLATGYRSLTDENAVGLSMLSLVTFSGSLTELVKAWVDLEISLGAIARVKAFCFGAPQEAKEDGEYNTDIPDNWPSSGRVEFRDVSARYRKLDGSSHLVLNSISFTIGNGRKLGLTGRTGSGKSSILAVLLRMIDYSGSVRIDGLELRTIPREVIRTRFITLAQDGLQLQGSVRLNLDPYNPLECESSRDGASRLSDQALEQALTRVGLWEGIRNFGGLDLDMGAANFSQGQLQLFGIARAILRKSYSFSKIVLIDEATSSIDNDKDREMQAMIGDAFANCTVFMVSHRLYAFDRMHKVLMLNDGQIEDTLKRDPGSGLLVEA